MLLNEQETGILEERVSLTLRFRPDAKYRGHSLLWWKRPFRLPKPWAVYALDNMSQAQIERMTPAVKNALLQATEPGKRLYAMDWHHCAFLYDPRKEHEQKRVKLAEEGGKYPAAFPFYYPDGDYYFFLDENFRFGYLGQPWRKEIWAFGEALLPELARIAPDLGWTKLIQKAYRP